MPVLVPHVWNLKIPPRVQFFLCLLSKSKVLTRDNLSVRKKVDDMTCLFCEENEHVGHLFFWLCGCHVAVVSCFWNPRNKFRYRFPFNRQMWLSNRKFVVEYVFCAATQWGLWKLRNNLCIQGSQWKNEQSLLTMILGMLQRWTTLSPAEKRVEYHIYHVVDTESFGHKTAKD